MAKICQNLLNVVNLAKMVILAGMVPLSDHVSGNRCVSGNRSDQMSCDKDRMSENRDHVVGVTGRLTGLGHARRNITAICGRAKTTSSLYMYPACRDHSSIGFDHVLNCTRACHTCAQTLRLQSYFKIIHF